MTAEEIAAGLTKAQREAVLSRNWQDWMPIRKTGLVYWGQNRRDNGLRLKMRPALLEVRAILEQEARDA